MKVAIQMDHINSIHSARDTTFALCLEAQKRGYELFHYIPSCLSLLKGKVFASLEPLKVYDRVDKYFCLGSAIKTDLTEMDIILLRQDPPFDMAYITTTYVLERIHPKTLVVNDPTWVRNSPEKIFVTEFPDLMPETLITKDEKDIANFRHTFGDIILKPLYGNGGAGIFYVSRDDPNFSSMIEIFKQIFREPFIVQQYLPAVRSGDKRIILIDGQPVGAINRIPANGEVRSNMHVGGKAEKTKLTKREKEICKRIGPILKNKGIILAGIDVIDNFMTEINVTSPTGLREIKHFDGVDLAEFFWNTVEAKR